MPWCHECETEYEHGFEKCPDCGCELSDEMPPSMLPKLKANWSFKGEKGVSDLTEWPKDEKGESVAAAFLTNVGGTQLDYEMVLSQLRAFSIPYASELTGSGQFTKVLMGFSGAGMDIYVPETLLEDAKNILFSDSEAQE